MADITIYLGNKNYSSWSLRAWLMLRRTGAPFDEMVIPIRRPDSRETILRYSPSGKVPVLHHGDRIVWDSLAIGEYLAETFPEARLWPADAGARAVARSVSAEMHSGFLDMRRAMPMNMRSSFPGREITQAMQADINRIAAIWLECRMQYRAEGPYLFGAFTIADAMFAPVVSRFRTYGVELDETPASYAQSLWSLPDLQEWLAAAQDEPWIIPEFEF
jgi:glutathione S-transferase